MVSQAQADVFAGFAVAVGEDDAAEPLSLSKARAAVLSIRATISRTNRQ